MTDTTRLRAAVALLVAHNEWRRGQEGALLIETHQIGQAIDIIAELVPGLIDGAGISAQLTELRDLLGTWRAEARRGGPSYKFAFSTAAGDLEQILAHQQPSPANSDIYDEHRKQRDEIAELKQQVAGDAQAIKLGTEQNDSISKANLRLLNEYDDALNVIRELRQKLAIAGVEGSPPPFETTIGGLRRERNDALARVKDLESLIGQIEFMCEGGSRDELNVFAFIRCRRDGKSPAQVQAELTDDMDRLATLAHHPGEAP